MIFARHKVGQVSSHMQTCLAVIPVVMVGAYWLGGEAWLTGLAVAVPVVLLLLRTIGSGLLVDQPHRDDMTGLMLRPAFDNSVKDTFARTQSQDLKSACLLIEIDEADDLLAQHGPSALDHIAQLTADRIIGALRPEDHVARLGDARFGICLTPIRHLDLEAGIQIAGRLQAVIEEPVFVDGLTICISASIGFCLSTRVSQSSWQNWRDAAQLALADAKQNGPSSIRAYTNELQNRHDAKVSIKQNVVTALDQGQVEAWFQPQLNTDTGQLSGFEALARWVHPVRGSIPPDKFLPAISAQGLMPRLTADILRQSLHALTKWDQEWLDVPTVSINLSEQDLDDPKLPDMIAWELDRFDLSPDRLCLEILETVVTDAPSDATVRSLQRLHKLGCPIDLDDYGTGHASIAAIKRFPINRIKIDRSFVVKADQDPDQQRLISALLTMAERLELETLAEGVETVGEHALLAQLGCGYVQGFGIARPMPFEDTMSWLKNHRSKIQKPPQIKRRTG